MINEQVVIDDQTGSAGIRRNKGVVSHVEVDMMMCQRGRPADASVRSSGKVAEDLVLCQRRIAQFALPLPRIRPISKS